MSNYEFWYEEAVAASNEPGYAGMSASDVIRHQGTEIENLRAALAPTAVVMPERMAYQAGLKGTHAGYNRQYVNAYNAALDEVARLNRNAIPVELLKLALRADASQGASTTDLANGWKAMAELRALLGKEGG